MPDTLKYGLRAEVAQPYAEVVGKVRDELAREGFGVLTEIDVKHTLKQKLDVEFRPYVILGACNPPLAHQALVTERDIGLLLPCNVVVYAADQANRTVVTALDPVKQLGIAENDALLPLAQDVRARLERVLERLAA